MPKIAKKQMKSKQIFARLIAGSSSQTTEGREEITSARTEVLSSARIEAETTETIEAAGSARRSPKDVENVLHPSEGFKITSNFLDIFNLYLNYNYF